MDSFDDRCRRDPGGSRSIDARPRDRRSADARPADARPADARRRLLGGALAALPVAAASASGAGSPARPPRPTFDPFGLGVASGDPGSDRIVLWTRLVATDGGSPTGRPGTDVAIDVRWQLAADPALRQTVATGRLRAVPADAHAVRVQVDGLAPDRPYWYRFHALGYDSPIGRTRTLPGAGGRSRPLRIAVASCQNFEHGHFAAYRQIAADEPDLVVHLGDYIYEVSWGRVVRPLGLPEARTLTDYRTRYARYRSEPELQAAHAAAPWVAVWDDHEVANDYADLVPERLGDAPDFGGRRAAAYRAWYEHMPVPPSLAPRGPALPIHRAFRLGDLALLTLLDTRQYRSRQACPPPQRAGGNAVVPADCAELADPRRTLLGAAQEAWLARTLARSTARWNLIGQQTLMSPLALPAAGGAPPRIRTDGWDGYPAARQRIVDAIRGSRLANPVVLGGDLHAFYVADLPGGERPDDPAVATEFVTTSISSQAAEQRHYDRQRAANPRLHYANGSQRGYLRLTLRPDRLDADLVGLADVRRADSTAATQAAWVVAAGRLGALPG
ncbi:MAG: alkaline phosphatase [Lautropia sp.]